MYNFQYKHIDVRQSKNYWVFLSVYAGVHVNNVTPLKPAHITSILQIFHLLIIFILFFVCYFQLFHCFNKILFIWCAFVCRSFTSLPFSHLTNASNISHWFCTFFTIMPTDFRTTNRNTKKKNGKINEKCVLLVCRNDIY